MTDTEAKATEPEIFSPEHMAVWLRSRPAETEYCWANDGVCLFSQYGEFTTGLTGAIAYAACINAPRLRWAFGAGIAMARPHTFGGALKRVNAVIAERKAKTAEAIA